MKGGGGGGGGDLRLLKSDIMMYESIHNSFPIGLATSFLGLATVVCVCKHP